MQLLLQNSCLEVVSINLQPSLARTIMQVLGKYISEKLNEEVSRATSLSALVPAVNGVTTSRLCKTLQDQLFSLSTRMFQLLQL